MGKNNKGGKKRESTRPHREKKPSLVLEGRVQMLRDGSAYIIIEGDEDDVYVKSSKMAMALNGDMVQVAVTKAKAAKAHREGYVIGIVERSGRPFVGYLHVAGSQAWVIMQSKNMPYDISVPFGADDKGSVIRSGADGYIIKGVIDEEGNELSARQGMKVSAVVDCWKRGDACPSGHIVDVLGTPGDNDTEMHAILAEYDLPYRFEPEVSQAADSISDAITEKDLEGRRDFRDILTFTIDPKDAKDFDDALSFRTLPDGNYEVGVHIADVTYYVTPESIVDKEAKARGTSVYLVGRTVPMLPEKLSNKLCSLRPNEEKLTFSAVFVMTPQAQVVEQWFGRTAINSNWRFDYEAAQNIIEAGEVQKSEVPAEVQDAVLALNGLAAILRRKRFAAGAISFERPEMKVLVDEKGKPIDVCQKISKEANWLIEEFMLLANRSVAEFVAKKCLVKAAEGGQTESKTFVYRIHDEPNQLKLESLRKFVGNFGYQLGQTNGGPSISRSLNALFEESKGTPEASAIELLSLRTMAKARYDVNNIGHYGLAFKYYTHFTSPIRRYPDMMVHRLLARYLKGGDSAKKDVFAKLCESSSQREVIAAEAERASIKYKLVEYMEDKLGQEFMGHISGLTDWGMYVEVEPTKIEGMVPLREIRSDFFEFDEDSYLIKGRRTRKIFRLGDEVKVRVKNTNLEQKQLDYELIEEIDEERANRRREYEKGRGYINGEDGSFDRMPTPPKKPSYHKRNSRKKNG